MKCVPLTDFVHNTISAREGVPIEIADGTAADLERAGLVRIRLAPDKAVAVGKVTDDGLGQPSSSSPAAPASPIQTSSLPRHGAETTRKRGR